MVFIKSLASFGIGAATVDTQLENNQIIPGELVRGEVVVRGGQTDQQINDIYLYLIIEFTKNDKKTPYILKKYQLAEAFLIQSGQVKKIPFEIKLPMETPMSCGYYPIYLKTGLHIKMAVDPVDTDKIDVLPIPIVSKILKEVEDANFILYKIHNYYDEGQQPHPFFQLLQFRPTGRYYGVIDLLNVIFDITNNDMKVDFEFIRADRVLMNSYYWQSADPKGTLHINNQPIAADPVAKIKEMLRGNK